MPESKLKTYVGFALRSGSVVFGLDNLTKSFKKIFCVLCDRTASENTQLMAKKFCEQKKIDFKQLKNIDEVFGTTNCKVVGLTNKELSKQILKCEE